MASATLGLQVRGLGKRQMAELVEQARLLGMTPEEYVKHVVGESS